MQAFTQMVTGIDQRSSTPTMSMVLSKITSMLVKLCSFGGLPPRAEADESSRRLPGTKSLRTFMGMMTWCLVMWHFRKTKFGKCMERTRTQALEDGQQSDISTKRQATVAKSTQK